MGKYGRLGHYLRNIDSDSIELSFSNIEGILGFPLPKSAYKYRPWWANDENHVQAQDGWLSAGYNSEAVDIENRNLNFRRVGESKKPLTINELSKRELTPREFEKFAQLRMSQYFGVNLSPKREDHWPKLFDMVSSDFKIVGDAKYLSMVKGKFLPPAKLSMIAENVWMLEKLSAKIKFLVFGNDIRVPKEWIKRYGKYVDSVDFYFLSNDGKLTNLFEN